LEVATAAGTEKEEEKGENPFGIGDLCLSVYLSVSLRSTRAFARARVSERERERSEESQRIENNLKRD
jgi:hypothetical protein